jgi:hypothetical protein
MKIQTLILILITTLSLPVLAGELTQSQRDAVLKGMFHGCVETVPKEISQRFGPMGVKRFCSCYADEIANNLTKEQYNAMIVDPNTGRSKVPPNYATTVSNANRVCAKEMTSQ